MKYVVFVLIALLGTSLDLITKLLAFRFIEPGTVEIIPGVLRLKCVLNTGIIWGLWQGSNIIFLALSILSIPIIILLFRAVVKSESAIILIAAAFGLILAGAIGNLYDRLFYSGVRDFIDCYIINWPIFNIADSFITIGAILIIVNMFRKPRPVSQ
ncbi:MAG: signal peptidase II [Planctomycetes bacterium]|nr:signal peptidase II [Planctomycetota bacterium]